MKITCQACQSKYTIADDKIQGKVAKIRCRKCGATVLVDASAPAHAESDGAAAPAAAAAAAGGWLVNVADGDQRSMSLAEVVDAYNTGAITADTYLWKSGMTDWVPLAQAEDIVAALNQAAAVAAPPASAQAPPPAPHAAPSPALDYSSARQAQAPVGAAARRETARARSEDLFGAGAPVEQEVATSAPHVARAAAAAPAAIAARASGTGAAPTGKHDEQSVLFSLGALTTAKSSPNAAASSKRTEDSGLIDLAALAKAQESQQKAQRAAPAAPSPAMPAAFLFPAALGTIEVPDELATGKKKRAMGLFIGIGVAVAGVAIALALVLSKPQEAVVAPGPSAVPSASAAPSAAPTAVASTEPTPATSASAADKGKPPPGGPRKGGGGVTTAKTAPQGGASPPPPPTTPTKGKCGCTPGDLQCMIRCSATGK